MPLLCLRGFVANRFECLPAALNSVGNVAHNPVHLHDIEAPRRVLHDVVLDDDFNVTRRRILQQRPNRRIFRRSTQSLALQEHMRVQHCVHYAPIHLIRAHRKKHAGHRAVRAVERRVDPSYLYPALFHRPHRIAQCLKTRTFVALELCHCFFKLRERKARVVVQRLVQALAHERIHRRCPTGSLRRHFRRSWRCHFRRSWRPSCLPQVQWCSCTSRILLSRHRSSVALLALARGAFKHLRNLVTKFPANLKIIIAYRFTELNFGEDRSDRRDEIEDSHLHTLKFLFRSYWVDVPLVVALFDHADG